MLRRDFMKIFGLAPPAIAASGPIRSDALADISSLQTYNIPTTLTIADMIALKDIVIRDFPTSREIVFFIHRDQEPAVLGMLPNFVMLLPGSIAKIDDRLIGFFDGIAVWVKPWMPKGHVQCRPVGKSS